MWERSRNFPIPTLGRHDATDLVHFHDNALAQHLKGEVLALHRHKDVRVHWDTMCCLISLHMAHLLGLRFFLG